MGIDIDGSSKLKQKLDSFRECLLRVRKSCVLGCYHNTASKGEPGSVYCVFVS